MVRTLALLMVMGGYAHATDITTCTYLDVPILQLTTEDQAIVKGEGPFEVFNGSEASTIKTSEKDYVFFRRTNLFGWYQGAEWKEIKLECHTTHKDGRRLKGDRVFDPTPKT